MKVKLTQAERELILSTAETGDSTLFPQRVAALLTGDIALTMEDIAALFLYYDEERL